VSLAQFVNEPLLELRRESERVRLADALAGLDAQLPLAVPVVVGGERRPGDGIDSTDPGDAQRLVATAAVAGPDEVSAAVERAAVAAAHWARRPAGERSTILEQAAGTLRARRFELAALEVRECAKPWAEADADVCEAIDFLRYYARGAVELDKGRELAQAPGEHNSMTYAARGVTAVISPWNFPLAIPAGMTAAALATGNAAVLKPAEQSPACALALVDALHEAGVPADALALLPGYGAAGATLVRDPRVHTIAFTGSSPVGLEIIRAAAQTPPGQTHVKRVVAEMGGKNCAIVDADADLDEAVPAIIRSAFAYAGQKCSACSRVLAHEAIHERLRERLAGAVEALAVGQAETFGIDVPPVIEPEAAQRIRDYVDEGERDGVVAARATAPAAGECACDGVLLAELPTASRILAEEIFGPVLTVEPVAGVDAACEIVEGMPFALTGGLFSRDPATVATVAERLPVGNLYVNRRLTGAVVARQPFGGNRLSGVGSKAGGPDYLLAFVEPRVVSENTMRHGLVT